MTTFAIKLFLLAVIGFGFWAAYKVGDSSDNRAVCPCGPACRCRDAGDTCGCQARLQPINTTEWEF